MSGRTPYYADDWLTVHQGDCREVMASMEPESVHCVVTSPPYWGLRDYGTATWVGGDEACDHKGEPFAFASSSLAGYTSENVQVRTQRMPMGPSCRKCGATREDGQLGLEPTPEAYVANMVAVFREVRRVLRDDGTVWINLGDSYAAERGGTHQPAETLAGGRHGKTVDGEAVNRGRTDGYSPTRDARAYGLKHKDLVGIPWRVAFALQSDGWYLRSDIIWAKPNPMPESVTDRPTKSHEYLFLLSKSARYHFDAAAVAEPLTDSSVERLSQATIDEQVGSFRVPGKTNGAMRAVGGPSWQERKAAGATAGNIGVSSTSKATRNIRSVWTIATQPYPGAHFATFPPKLVEPCIKAGCPSGGTVLDPFGGSGTTGMVAQSLGRRAVLIDLNGDYLVQAMRRNAQSPLGLDVA